MHSILLKNTILYTDYESGKSSDVFIEDRQIKRIFKTNVDPASPRATQTIDLEGRVLSPGFIDVHIHGASGVDTLTGTSGSVETMCAALGKLGTTCFLPTAVAIPDKLNQYLPNWVRATKETPVGAKIPGLHLEGPFVNPQRRGGLFQEGVVPPSSEILDSIFNVTDGTLRMMTIAPELKQNNSLVTRLFSNDVIPAFGHTDATYEQSKEIFARGVNHVTHLYNAMPGLHHREPGPLLAILENRSITTQLICDGRHVSPDMVRWTYEQLGPDRIVCITDGMQAIGLPEGRYDYNGREYESKNGSAYYLDGTLIGTSLSLAQLVLNYWKFTGCTLEEAVNAGSLNPAKVLKIDTDKGSIARGKDADLVIFDHDFSIWKTIISGKVFYEC